MSTDEILQIISEIHIPKFFITVDFMKTMDTTPTGIEEFLKKKHQSIIQGVNGRKFVYQNNGWRMAFTFYPTDSVVDEKYAMKNKMVKQTKVCHNSP